LNLFSSSSSYGSSINTVVAPKQIPTYNSFRILSRPFNQQPLIPTNNYGTAQDQPIVMNQPSSWSSPFPQTPPVNTNQQTQQYGQSYNQQPQFSFVPQQPQPSSVFQQPMRSFNRVFQPELTRNLNTQTTSSGYRR